MQRSQLLQQPYRSVQTVKGTGAFYLENMFPQEVLDGFEKETGIKIVYSNFDTDETMFEKLSMAKGGDYDIGIADDYIIENVVQEKVLQKNWTSQS